MIGLLNWLNRAWVYHHFHFICFSCVAFIAFTCHHRSVTKIQVGECVGVMIIDASTIELDHNLNCTFKPVVNKNTLSSSPSPCRICLLEQDHPNRPFSEPQNQNIVVSEVHGFRQSLDFEVVSLQKVWSGSERRNICRHTRPNISINKVYSRLTMNEWYSVNGIFQKYMFKLNMIFLNGPILGE